MEKSTINEAMVIFQLYKPIKAIYENESEYICIPDTDTEPLSVFYDKTLGNYKELYWYEYDPSNDIESSNLIYGEELSFKEN